MKKLSIFVLALFFTGCANLGETFNDTMHNTFSTKVKMQMTEPAKIKKVGTIKNIAVTDFRNRDVDLSKIIETQLVQYQFDNQSYYTVVDRDDLNSVLKEQKLSDSGFLTKKNYIELGEILNADGILTGKVKVSQITKDTLPQRKLKGSWSSLIKSVKVRCKKRSYTLEGNMKLINTRTGDIVYSEILNKAIVQEKCEDDSFAFDKPSVIFSDYIDDRVSTFIENVTPKRINIYVPLMTEPDIKYNSKDAKTLELALDFISAKRFDKAENYFEELIERTYKRSIVPFYNLGVLEEREGELEEALEHYKKADALVKKPLELLDEAIIRVKDRIKNKEKF